MGQRSYDRASLYNRIVSTTRGYDRIAADFAKKWFDNPILVVARPFLTFVPNQGIILDIGCGPGQYLKFFLSQSYRCVGIDMSKAMLAEARYRTKCDNLARMNMLNLGFQNSSFDAIWACASLCHIPVDLVPDVLQELRRLLKPRGIIFISIQEGNGSEIREDGRFFQYHTEDSFCNLLTSSGLSIALIIRSETVVNRPKTWLQFFCRPNWQVQ